MDVNITASLSYIVFAFGSLLVAIQVSSAQLTPRIIATTLLRDNVIRWIVGIFVCRIRPSCLAVVRLDAGHPPHLTPICSRPCMLSRGMRLFTPEWQSVAASLWGDRTFRYVATWER